MNRRGFLSVLAGALAAAHDFDPERALWVPGRKKIFIPPQLQTYGQGFEIADPDVAFSLDRFAERYVATAVANIFNRIDLFGCWPVDCYIAI